MFKDGIPSIAIPSPSSERDLACTFAFTLGVLVEVESSGSRDVYRNFSFPFPFEGEGGTRVKSRIVEFEAPPTWARGKMSNGRVWVWVVGERGSDRMEELVVVDRMEEGGSLTNEESTEPGPETEDGCVLLSRFATRSSASETAISSWNGDGRLGCFPFPPSATSPPSTRVPSSPTLLKPSCSPLSLDAREFSDTSDTLFLDDDLGRKLK